MAIELKVPSVGESITEVEIGDWLKREGESVEKDENVVALESEKATVELPAPSAGVLTKITKHKGDKARIGETIAEIDPAAKPQQEARAARPATQEQSATPQPSGSRGTTRPTAEPKRRVMPAAQQDVGRNRNER